ncbi:hypothetical protein BU15DRAFT_64245 [Melanogaster broomeanus]|nr:hypothetical protein BU15DRAFT_64245 [Melanogaster broomeanus]
MANNRTPDDDLPLTSNMNTFGGRATTQSRPPSQPGNPGSVTSAIAHSSNATLLSHSIPHQHHSQLQTQSHPAPSHSLPHSSQTQALQRLLPSSSDAQSHPASTSWFHQGTSTTGPAISHPDSTTDASTTSTSMSTSIPSESSASSSMIVSTSSFYDSAHAGGIPDYQQLSGWNPAFGPSFPTSAGGEGFYTAHEHGDTHTFGAITGVGGTAGGGGGSGGSAFQFVQSGGGFGFQRMSGAQGQGQAQARPGQGQSQQRRPIAPIPRRMRGVGHYNQGGRPRGQVQAQAQGQEQWKSSIFEATTPSPLIWLVTVNRRADNNVMFAQQQHQTPQELANQRTQQLLSQVSTSSSYTSHSRTQQPHSQPHQMQSQSQGQIPFSTPQEQGNTSDIYNAPEEYPVQSGTDPSFSSAQEYSPTALFPSHQHQTAEFHYQTTVATDVEVVNNEQTRMYYAVQASQSMPSLVQLACTLSWPRGSAYFNKARTITLVVSSSPLCEVYAPNACQYALPFMLLYRALLHSAPGTLGYWVFRFLGLAYAVHYIRAKVLGCGTGVYSLSPAGSYHSYPGTTPATSSSVDETSGSGSAVSGVSSSNMSGVSASSQGHGVGEGQRGELGHGQGGGQGGHIHSTSMSTVTASPPSTRAHDHRQGGEMFAAAHATASGSSPTGGVGFGTASSSTLSSAVPGGYQVQTSYAAQRAPMVVPRQPQHQHHAHALGHPHPQAHPPSRAHVSAQSQPHVLSDPRMNPPFTNPHAHAHAQGYSHPHAQAQQAHAQPLPQPQPHTSRNPPPSSTATRASAKRPRAPKRPRPSTSMSATGMGGGASGAAGGGGDVGGSDDDSDDDEVVEWGPGAGGAGGGGGTGGVGAGVTSLLGGRKCAGGEDTFVILLVKPPNFLRL